MTETITQLGEIVSWSSPTEIEFSKLSAALVAANLDEKLARQMLPRNAFRRAAHELEESRVIEQVDETDDTLVFQFTRKYLDDSAKTMDYRLETKLELEKVSGNVWAIGGDPNGMALTAKRLLDEQLAKRNANDVTRIVQTIFRRNGDLFSIRDQGGVYFVPERHAELTDSVEDFLGRIGGKVRRFEISAGGRSNDSVAQSVSEGVKSMIHEFQQRVESYDDDMSARVQANRVVEIGQLRLKMEAYQDVMLGYADDVKKALAHANKVLKAKIHGVDLSETGSGSGTEPGDGNGRGTQDNSRDAASAVNSRDDHKEVADRPAAPVAHVSREIADAFGMHGLPNTVVHDTPKTKTSGGASDAMALLMRMAGV